MEAANRGGGRDEGGGFVPEIVALDADTARRSLPELIALLRDAVAGGASIGFLPPLAAHEAATYWDGVLADLATGKRLLIAAVEHGRVIGSVQLELAGRANGWQPGDWMRRWREASDTR